MCNRREEKEAVLVIDYSAAGAIILPSLESVYDSAEMIIKVKEPIEREYKLIRKSDCFTYFHFASSESLTKAMIDSKAVCIAYETVESEDHSLPLLIPMSEVAGRMSVQQGAKYLEKPLAEEVFYWVVFRGSSG